MFKCTQSWSCILEISAYNRVICKVTLATSWGSSLPNFFCKSGAGPLKKQWVETACIKNPGWLHEVLLVISPYVPLQLLAAKHTFLELGTECILLAFISFICLPRQQWKSAISSRLLSQVCFPENSTGNWFCWQKHMDWCFLPIDCETEPAQPPALIVTCKQRYQVCYEQDKI